MKNYIDEVKTKIGRCADCGFFCEDWNVMMFAFDHLNPTIKSSRYQRQHSKKTVDKNSSTPRLRSANLCVITAMPTEHGQNAHILAQIRSARNTFLSSI